ncbi:MULTISPECIES: hypothetical protein [Brevibacillus]|uniref:hypothetical protein n=1 Tax=Brevibacillus TaxID=55080 RepID=UPI001147718F|nr:MULTISPECIES: hypothetical protein [Brevibacillus]UYZ13024.1 hypothetical protein A6764_19940 [Brevibacillus sp. WF146]
MKKMKMMMLAISLTSVVATSAYAANIYFEQGTGVSISYDSDNTQWRSDAVTIGSYGTKYARAYTEIWGGGKKRGYKESKKESGTTAYASAYCPIGLDDTYATSNHRIWWSSSDADSITTSDRTEL